jgi:hypothetical protein
MKITDLDTPALLQQSRSAGDSWLAPVQDSVRTLPGPLAELTERLRVFRFRPGIARALTPFLQGVTGRRFALGIENP